LGYGCRMDDESDLGSRVGYFLIGLAAGAIGAILFAPCSGDETREFLAAKAQDGMLYAKDAIEDAKEQFQATLDRAGDAVLNVKDRVGAATDEAGDRLREAVRAGKVAYEDEIHERRAAQENPPSA
jgi:gas vesicle protein